MTYSAEVLADSPLAWWRLDEPSGSTFADSSGNGRDLAITGTPTFSQAAPGGGLNKSVAFTGSQYASLAAPSWFTAGSAWTLECWVKTSTASMQAGLITRDNAGQAAPNAARMIELELSSGKAALEVFNASTSNFVLASGTMTDGVWRHLAMTYNGTTATLYVNGASIGTCSLAGPLTAGTAAPLMLGATYNNGSIIRNLIGSLAEPAVYGTALSGTRILAHYNAGVAAASVTGAAAMSAQASLADAGADTLSLSASLSAQASLGDTPSLTKAGVDTLSAQASLGDTGADTLTLAAPLSAQASLGVVGVASTIVAMSAEASLGDAPSLTKQGVDALSVQASLGAAPSVSDSSGADMSAQASLGSAPSLVEPGAAAMSAQATLGADGTALSSTTRMSFTFGALDLAIDTTPTDVAGTMAFTFGGLDLSMTSGAPAMALYDEHNNWIANLPKAIIGNWMNEISAPGALTCSLPTDDAATALVTKKRILKVYWRGKARQAARVDGSSIQVAKDGRRWRQFNDRPGAMNMLADIAVFPEVELSRASSSQRICGFMSRIGPWYDSGNWSNAIGYLYTDETDVKAGKPVGLSYPNPHWISKYGPHVTRPAGSTEYIRKGFVTTSADVPYQILTTGDNSLWLWLDGELIVTPDMQGAKSWKVLAQVTGTLAAGRHVIAAKIVNAANGAHYNPVGFIFTMQQMQPNGDVVLGHPIINSDLTWSVSDVHPGFRGGDVIVTLFKEGVDRAVAAGQWFQAVNTISLGFDHTRDSHGVAWADDPTEHTLDAGSTVLSAIQQIAEKNLDVVLDPGSMVLNAYNLLGSDLSGSVFLNVGSGVTGTLLEHMIDRVEASGNTALIQLGDGRWIVEQDAASVAEIGRVEVGLSLGTTSDTDTAAGVAQTHFAESANTTYTFTTTVSDLEGPQPLVNFNIGDSISVTDEDATGYFKVRVMAMTFKPKGRRVSIDVELALDPT